MAIARDKFWLFGVRPHQDDIWFGSRHKPNAGRKFSYSRITPAEGAFMLDIPYVGSGYDRAYVQDVLRRLAALGAKIAVLTGVSFEDGKVGVMAYDSQADSFFEYYNDRIDASYHGTGDVFASTCVGALMNGKDLQDALCIAADYTAECIRLTEEEPGHNWYGVNFETAIPTLLRRLGR